MAAKKILVINPNSSKSMTDSLDILISDFNREVPVPTQIDTYTAPAGPPSINNETDAMDSAKVVIVDLLPRLGDYDAYLVACYSVHPLVGMLRQEIAPHVHVTGIFEASISTAMALLPLHTPSRFGIVSTGSYWKKTLSDGVQQFFGCEGSATNNKFKGVETTGLNANELHTTDADEVKKRMKDATKRLVRDRDVKVVVLGCAGMAGMDSIIEEALSEELGVDAKGVHVLDGVKAGIGLLEGLMRALPAKPERRVQ